MTVDRCATSAWFVVSLRFGRLGEWVHDLIRCVDEFLSRAERERPVLVLTGCRRCGKTTTLERIREQLELIGLPHSVNDYATLPARTPVLLTTLMFGLNRHSVYGRLSFPRLLVGLIVMPPLDLDQRDPARAREQVRLDLEEYHDIGKLRSFLSRLGGNSLALVPHLAETGLNDLIGTLLEGLLMRGVLGTRLGRKVLLGPGIDWYGHQDRGLSLAPLDVLVELNRRATGMDDSGNEANRQWVARVLWGAFLADLDASFAGHDDWDRNCAVLIDNADTGAGLTFIGELNEALAMRRETGLADPPLTVIAASREELVRRALPLGGKPVPVRDAGLADYQRRLSNDKAAKRGWYALLLPNLTEIETRNLVASRGRITNVHGQATDELLAPVIFQFTGGHPEATRLIVAELTGSADPADLATVLPKTAESPVAQTADGGEPSVEEWLALSLTAGLSEDAIDNLVKCAAARDQADASRLDLESGLLIGTRAALSDLFARELWGEPTASDVAALGTVVMLPVLRRLLLRRLAASPDDWDEAFTWLKTASALAGHREAELYYALALGEVEPVAQRLAGRLSPQMTEDAAIDWLARWHTVTAAPRPGSAGIRAIPQLVSWADPADEPSASVAALVAARWLLANSLRAGDLRALRREIAASLDTVARFAGEGRDAFRTQAGTYRRLAES
jgi:hypothetical protein